MVEVETLDRLAVRLLAAVRLRRDVHVRGRHAERRAARGGAVARPRPAARAARPGRAARADRPRRARRGRGRPPAPLGPHARGLERRARRRPAPRRRPDRRRGAGARARGRRRGRAARGAAPRAARDRRSASPARSAGSPPTTPASTATRSAPCRPAACRRRSSKRWTARSRSSSPRYARTHGPFTTAELRARYGVDPTPRAARRSRAPAISCAASCAPAAASASGATPTCCAASGARRSPCCARRSRPSTRARWRRFLPSWQGVDRHPAAGAGVDRLREALVPLQGLALPAQVWERDVLPRRVGAYSPAWLDQLTASGEVVWVGAGASGRSSGRVALYFRDDAAAIGPPHGQGPGARAAGRAGARGAARAARRRAVLLHRPARRAAGLRAGGAPGRALGPRLGRRGHRTTRSRRCARRA